VSKRCWMRSASCGVCKGVDSRDKGGRSLVSCGVHGVVENPNGTRCAQHSMRVQRQGWVSSVQYLKVAECTFKTAFSPGLVRTSPRPIQDCSPVLYQSRSSPMLFCTHSLQSCLRSCLPGLKDRTGPDSAALLLAHIFVLSIANSR
jgi:hypothetical protein